MPHHNLAENIRQLLRHYSPSEEETSFHETMMSHALDDQCHHRDRPLAHFTASAWVLHPDRDKVLLIFHNKLQRWLQPGGHLEATDESVLDSARREVAEECGLCDLEILLPGLFDIDVHLIPARNECAEHWHLDLRFLFRSPSEKTTLDLAEVSGFSWVSLDHAAATMEEPSLLRMVRKSLSFQSDQTP